MTRARDVANAGHSTTATTADTISQKTSIDLSGTYSTHQLLVADAYNFAGDTTVNDHLILGKLSDDGTDTVLEGSYVLQGTGQLEAGYISSSGIGSVDGMTGELGSAITGSPNLNLGNATFPAGHILQVLYANQEDYGTQLSSNTETKINSVNLTTIGTNSNFIIMCNVSHEVENVDADPCAAIGYKTGATSSTSTDYSAIHGAYSREVIGNMGSWYAQDTIGGSTAGTWGGAYQIRERSYQDKIDLSYAAGTQLDFASWIRAGGNPCRFGTSRNDSGGDNGCTIYLTVMEIAG